MCHYAVAKITPVASCTEIMLLMSETRLQRKTAPLKEIQEQE